jgi:tetratricopeptide (TPR) repeat protein
MAVFHRADTLWFVLDTTVPIDLSALEGEASRTIRRADFFRTSDADVVRIRLDRPHLSSVATEGPTWSVTIGDAVLEPTHALDLMRNMIGPNRSSVTIPFEQPHSLHRIRDPEVGDNILVVTAFAPARGVLKEQDFIEFRALASTQGVVVEPIADDLSVELAADKVMVSRPGGLTLSNSLQSVLHGSGLRPLMFDSQLWGFDRQATYSERQASLIAAAAAAPPSKRLALRLELARFYIARDMYAEAKSVLDVALADNRPTAEVASASVLRAVAELMMNRPEDALKDLAGPAVGDQHDAPLWRAIAYSRQGNWAQANGGFRRAEAAIATLPIELQRIALKDEMRAAIEVSDFAGAGNQLNDFETIGVPRDMRPALSVLIGRLSEGLGHTDDALAAYRAAADSWDRPAAAQGRLRETLLRHAIGDLKRDEVVSELETLTAVWRGDETEVEALQVLARLYTEEGRYRDSFYVMRSAMAARPDSEMTRRIQEGAAATFEALFLAGKGDALPAVDALALFYDFRELTPIGRRGDEMIRRLADRLASVDLLDQAADLLQYQVDHRLQGAARAQVATRLAVIYLMNRKSDPGAGDLAGDAHC